MTSTLTLKALAMRCTMYNVDITEDKFLEWNELWKKSRDSVKAHLADTQYTIYKYLGKFTVDESSIHLFMQWDAYTMREPAFSVVSDVNLSSTGKENLKDKTWILGDRGGYGWTDPTQVAKAYLIDEALEPENFPLIMLLMDIHSLRSNQGSPFKFTDDAVLGFQHQTKDTLETYFQENFAGFNYESLNRVGAESLKSYINWFCKLKLGKPAQDIFPNLITGFRNPENFTACFGKSDNNFIQRIIDVYETEAGDRYYVVAGNTSKTTSDRYRNYRGSIHNDYNISIHFIESDKPNWEYIDLNRKMYFHCALIHGGTNLHLERHGGYNYNMQNMSEWQHEPYAEPLSLCRALFIEDHPITPKSIEPLKRMANRNQNRPISLLTNTDIDRIIKLEVRKELDSRKDEKFTEILETKWSKRLAQLEEDHKLTVDLNEVTYNYTQVEYEGQILKLSDFKPTSQLKRLINHWDKENVDFDRYFDSFLGEIHNRVARSTEKESFTGIVGKVPFKIDMTPRVDSRNRVSMIATVNNIRINKKEIQQVLKKGICFDDILTFNNFLESVSKCSLEIHNFIHFGIKTTVRDEFLGLTMKLKFLLHREKNRHYLQFEDEIYPIHQIGKILSISAQNRMDAVLDILGDEKTITMDLGKLAPIVKQARLEYEAAIKKSEALLARIATMVGTKREKRSVKGTTRDGYFIEGKMRNYFLEHTTEAAVYDLNREVKLCIIEKSGHGGNDPTDQVGADKIVNRMLALKNDNKVVSYVHTLR